MRHFVDKNQVGIARQRPIQIELLDGHAVFLVLSFGQRFQSFHERERLRPIVRFDVANDDVAAKRLGFPGGDEHAVCLAHAGRVAEKDF